jgi:hypothetical protein
LEKLLRHLGKEKGFLKQMASDELTDTQHCGCGEAQSQKEVEDQKGERKKCNYQKTDCLRVDHGW